MALLSRTQGALGHLGRRQGRATGAGRGRTRVCILEKGPPHSRSPRSLGRPACASNSWSLLPSPLGAPLGKMACHGRPAILLGSPRALGWGRSTLERGVGSRAWIWGSLLFALRLRGACQAVAKGSAGPLPSSGPRRASAANLLPSRSGGLSPRPLQLLQLLLLAAAGSAGRAQERLGRRRGGA